jgi:hypothetical protein
VIILIIGSLALMASTGWSIFVLIRPHGMDRKSRSQSFEIDEDDVHQEEEMEWD